MTDGMRHLMQTLKRCGRWLKSLPGRLRGGDASSAAPHGAAPVDVVAARARFWSGVQEGRREAEARGAKRTP